MNCAWLKDKPSNPLEWWAETSERPRVIFLLSSYICSLSKNDTVFRHSVTSLLNSNTTAADERTHATEVNTIRAVGVFSITRRNRNHQDETIRRTAFAGTSHRLRTTKPNPPA